MIGHCVSTYLNQNHETENRFCDSWTMLEYSEGHFSEHIDKQEDTETHYQVATQILLPPKEFCNY